MTKFMILTALSAAIATLSGPAATQAPARRPVLQPLSRAAFVATMDAEYRKLDANGDGTVTQPELEAQQARNALAMATQQARVAFARMDADRNGQISVDEFVRAQAAPVRRFDGSAMMSRLDSDRNRKVSLVEYRIVTLAGYDLIDTDRDGILTPAEQQAAGMAK